jgi:hypothetical protein
MAHHQGGGMLWETTKSCAVSAPHPCPNVVEFPRSRPRTWGAHPHNPSCEHSTLVARRGGSALYNASILVESGGATAGPVCLRTGPFPAPSLESTTSRKHDSIPWMHRAKRRAFALLARPFSGAFCWRVLEASAASALHETVLHETVLHETVLHETMRISISSTSSTPGE